MCSRRNQIRSLITDKILYKNIYIFETVVYIDEQDAEHEGFSHVNFGLIKCGSRERMSSRVVILSCPLL
jgi:hypothetical protein